MLFELMDFLIELKMRYNVYNLPQWTHVAEDALSVILSVIPSKKFISKINDINYSFIHDEYLMEKTVSHYKELRGIFNSCKKVNASDWWATNDKIMRKTELGKLRELQTQKKKPGNCTLMFNECKHFFKVHKGVAKKAANGSVYCNECEVYEESRGK
jgi:hypothetical protein